MNFLLNVVNSPLMRYVYYYIACYTNSELIELPVWLR